MTTGVTAGAAGEDSMILSGIHSGTEVLDLVWVGIDGDGTVGAGMAGDGINLFGAVVSHGTTGVGEATDSETTIDMEEGWRTTTALTEENLHSPDGVV